MSDNECVICLTALDEGTPVSLSECNHQFHLECLLEMSENARIAVPGKSDPRERNGRLTNYIRLSDRGRIRCPLCNREIDIAQPVSDTGEEKGGSERGDGDLGNPGNPGNGMKGINLGVMMNSHYGHSLPPELDDKINESSFLERLNSSPDSLTFGDGIGIFNHLPLNNIQFSNFQLEIVNMLMNTGPEFAPVPTATFQQSDASWSINDPSGVSIPAQNQDREPQEEDRSSVTHNMIVPLECDCGDPNHVKSIIDTYIKNSERKHRTSFASVKTDPPRSESEFACKWCPMTMKPQSSADLTAATAHMIRCSFRNCRKFCPLCKKWITLDWECHIMYMCHMIPCFDCDVVGSWDVLVTHWTERRKHRMSKIMINALRETQAYSYPDLGFSYIRLCWLFIRLLDMFKSANNGALSEPDLAQYLDRMDQLISSVGIQND